MAVFQGWKKQNKNEVVNQKISFREKTVEAKHRQLTPSSACPLRPFLNFA